VHAGLGKGGFAMILIRFRTGDFICLYKAGVYGEKDYFNPAMEVKFFTDSALVILYGADAVTHLGGNLNISKRGAAIKNKFKLPGREPGEMIVFNNAERFLGRNGGIIVPLLVNGNDSLVQLFGATAF
jgi:hypothetical protein